MPKTIHAQGNEWGRWPVVPGRWYIYGLHLEGDGEIRYVGSTQDVGTRYQQHQAKPTGGCKRWIKRHNSRVRIHVFGYVTSDPKGAERRMMQEVTGKGHRLLNIRLPRRLSQDERTELVTQWLDKLDVAPAVACEQMD